MYSLTNQALSNLELTLSEVHVGNCVFWCTSKGHLGIFKNFDMSTTTMIIFIREPQRVCSRSLNFLGISKSYFPQSLPN